MKRVNSYLALVLILCMSLPGCSIMEYGANDNNGIWQQAVLNWYTSPLGNNEPAPPPNTTPQEEAGWLRRHWGKAVAGVAIVAVGIVGGKAYVERKAAGVAIGAGAGLVAEQIAGGGPVLGGIPVTTQYYPPGDFRLLPDFSAAELERAGIPLYLTDSLLDLQSQIGHYIENSQRGEISVYMLDELAEKAEVIVGFMDRIPRFENTLLKTAIQELAAWARAAEARRRAANQQNSTTKTRPEFSSAAGSLFFKTSKLIKICAVFSILTIFKYIYRLAWGIIPIGGPIDATLQLSSFQFDLFQSFPLGLRVWWRQRPTDRPQSLRGEQEVRRGCHERPQPLIHRRTRRRRDSVEAL